MSEVVGNAKMPVVHEHYDIFMSYRRSTGLDLARSIVYWFRLKGFKCFLDQTELLTGQFNEQIYSAIEHTRYFLLLMTGDALDRCVNAEDWVRHEIEYAVKVKGRDCIIPITPVTPTPFPDCLPQTLEFLRTCEVSVIDRQKNFDSTLRTVVENRMPVLYEEIKKRNLLSENELQLLGTIRWYKRNDGTIDDDELKKIHEAAEEYQISNIRLQALIDQVEAEVAEEHDATIRRLIESCMADDGGIDSEERGAIDKKAIELNIPQARLVKIMAEIEGQKKAGAKTNDKLRQLHGLEEMNAELKAENERLVAMGKRGGAVKKWLWGFIGALVIAVGACLFMLLNGAKADDGQMRARFDSEKARITAEARQQVESAEKARAVADKSRLAAEKDAAASSLAREQAEKETKETKARLVSAIEAAAASDTARKEAEKQLADVKALSERQRAESLAAISEEQTARKDAETQLGEKSAELKRSSEKIKMLEAEKARLQKDLENLRRQVQTEAFRDI